MIYEGNRQGMPWTQEEIADVLMMHKRKFSYSDIAAHIGRSRDAVAKKMYEYTGLEPRKKPTNQSIQLCWSCSKFAGGCRWTKHFLPVEGWTATPKPYRHGGDRETVTYSIMECPEYEEG